MAARSTLGRGGQHRRGIDLDDRAASRRALNVQKKGARRAGDLH